MKRIFKKNHVIITALALLIAVAGYISFSQSNTDSKDAAATEQASGDEILDISEDDLAANIFTDTEESVDVATTESGDDAATEEGTTTDAGGTVTTQEDAAAATDTESDAGATVLTSAASSDIAAQMKLNREQTRSKNKETLMGIINNESVTDSQKQDAIDQLEEMTDVAEKETAAENLLMAKGFTNVVVIISDDGADVVLTMGDATEAKRAQIEDIVKRKTGIAAENIVITPIATS